MAALRVKVLWTVELGKKRLLTLSAQVVSRGDDRLSLLDKITFSVSATSLGSQLIQFLRKVVF